MSKRQGKTIRSTFSALLRLTQVALLATTLAACSSSGDSGNGTSPPPPPPPPPPPAGAITGVVQYEFPPPNNNCNGLNFGGVILRPIRQATVQLIDSNSLAVLDSTVSDDNGNYSLTVSPQTDVFVRVRAELKSTNPAWDVEVRDNVVDPTDPNPPALGDRPIYVMDGAPFNSGSTGQVQNLTAVTGWGGNSYTGVRVAAPFAVLDAIYRGITMVTAVDPGVNFEPLDAYWSPGNSSVQGTGTFDEDIAAGEIQTSFYSADRLFLLGMDGDDAEEFDDHVIVHEWGHYFEDNFSRSDSIGGAHGVGDLLDARVAFGEGFATALSGIALNDPIYCDTLWSGGQLRGFEIDIESENGGTVGWFNEISIMKLVYDLWDTDPDGADNSSIGFGPIYSIMTGAQAVTPAFTTIFSFATNLKQSVNAADETFIDALLAEQNINPALIDILGSTESNDGPGTPDDVLPIFTPLTLGVTESICVNSQFDNDRSGNKLSEHRYLTLDLLSTQQITFSATANPAPSIPSAGFDCTADVDDPENHEHSDPDFWIWQNGVWAGWGVSCEPNSETATMLLGAGNYVIDFNEFRHADEDTPAGFPDQVCFDFTAN